MAARWNSSRAPERPRNRIRSKPWCVFRCAKRISTSSELADAIVASVDLFNRDGTLVRLDGNGKLVSVNLANTRALFDKHGLSRRAGLTPTFLTKIYRHELA